MRPTGPVILLCTAVALTTAQTTVSDAVIGLAGYWISRTNNTLCAAASAIADINNDNSLLASTTLHTRTYATGCAAGTATDAAMQTFLSTLDGNNQTTRIVALVGPYCSTSAVAMSHVLAPGNAESMRPRCLHTGLLIRCHVQGGSPQCRIPPQTLPSVTNRLTLGFCER